MWEEIMPYVTNATVIPYPEVPPDPGSANSVITDPFCGNSILRVTDSSNIPDAAGASVVSASESSAWSSDGRAFYLVDRKSGGFRLYGFDPDNFTARDAGKLTLGSPEFSFQWPGVIWGIGEDLQIRRLDIATGENTLVVDLRDYAGELDIPDSPRWYLNSLSADYWDRRVACALGPGQDANERLLVYDLEEGLVWLDTGKGEYSGFGGWLGSIEPWTAFSVHDCRLSKNGDTLRSSGAGSNARAFWRPGTGIFQNVTPSPDVPICGHMATGFDTYFGAQLQTTPFQFIMAPLWNIAGWQDLMRPVPRSVPGWWSDYHISTRALGGDSSPLYISSYNAQGNPTTPGPPTAAVPGDNEIFAVYTDGSGRVARFAHHYSSAEGNFYNSPRGNVSPDGRFFIFASDWYMGLGGEYPNQRSDVFCLKLDT